MARRYDISPDLSGPVLLLLALGVSWVVLFDASRSRTRIFCQNLGVAPTTLFFLAFCTVVACEVVLAFGPTLLRSLGGG